MFSSLTESAEAASSKTLDAFAEVICALAPEVCSVSFHDVARRHAAAQRGFPAARGSPAGRGLPGARSDRQLHDSLRHARRLALLDRHSGARRTRRGQRRGAPDHRFGDRRSANPGAARAAARAADGLPLRRIRAPPRGTAPAGRRRRPARRDRERARGRTLRALRAAHPLAARRRVDRACGTLRGAAAAQDRRRLADRARSCSSAPRRIATSCPRSIAGWCGRFCSGSPTTAGSGPGPRRCFASTYRRNR